ncbi:MAG: sodium:alanine symporter family protein [Chlorobi bacterium]|nr:sodium:alanine symporter family protein [Chlorobiota bacterium]
MQQVKEFLEFLNQYLGGSEWFVFLLLGTGLFFTIYLKFPQFRYFKFAIRVVKGKYDKDTDVGDTSHFQALSTALSGTVGTGNIAGVALAIHIGGPAALFWMLVTALFGMTTKFVEVTLSHKYRDVLPDGSISGGPMYYMKKRLNINLKNGRVIQTGKWLGIFFALATILSSFGTGSLPQINSISNALFSTFNVKQVVSGAILTVLLALVIIGGIKRIAKVTSTMVPFMAIFYFLGAFFVIATNYENIIPSLIAIFRDVFTGTAAIGGFMGAGFAFAFNRGVNRGLFSNEAGQGSAPIAHSAARAHEPVSEGLVAILEPFIDTIIICSLTGLVLLASGAWHEKYPNQFQKSDMVMLARVYKDQNPQDKQELFKMFNHKESPPFFTGEISIRDGKMQNNLTLINASSIAEDVLFTKDGKPYTGKVSVENGNVEIDQAGVMVTGKSLLHSAPLTTEAFKKSILGDWGQYIVSIGLLLFAFSTAISWSYYGGRAMTFLFGSNSVVYYRLFYIVAFFFASFTDTTIIWALSYITIVLMALPNLAGLLILHKEVKSTIRQYWVDFKKEHPGVRTPE